MNGATMNVGNKSLIPTVFGSKTMAMPFADFASIITETSPKSAMSCATTATASTSKRMSRRKEHYPIVNYVLSSTQPPFRNNRKSPTNAKTVAGLGIYKK